MKNQGTIDICKCDVDDKKLLALFMLRRDEWKRCLIDDNFSVTQQISHLLWNDSVFRTFNEARKISIESGSFDVGLNGPVIDLLDEGFIVSQIMAIRRLSDPNFYDPKKAVISLVRILDDIGNSLSFFTRENYICCDGTAYEGLSEKDGIKFHHWEIKHKNFDRISGVSVSNRSRNDKLDIATISSLRSELDACKDLRTYANKFIAHTSDNSGKAKLTSQQKNITLNSLDKAYKSIVKVGSFLGAIVLYEHSLGGVPVPQFDQLKNLDKPIVKHKSLQDLYNFWEERCNEINLWDNEI